MGIGSIRNIIFGDCKFFLEDFGSYLAHASLPLIIFDNLGIGCKEGGAKRVFNALVHLGTTVGLVFAAQTKFSEVLGSYFEGIIGKNPKSAAFLLYYGGFNAALIIGELISIAIKPTDPYKPPDPAKCIINIFGCIKDFITYLVNNVRLQVGIPLGCGDDEDLYSDEQGSLCYKKLSDELAKDYECGGPVCWARCGDKERFRDDGAFCAKRTYSRGAGDPPPNKCPQGYSIFEDLCYIDCPYGGKRTASDTCSFGAYKGVATRCNIGIDDIQMGDECTNLAWAKIDPNHTIAKDKGHGWYKTAACSCQKGGLISSVHFDKLAHKVCPEGQLYDAGLCYGLTKPGYKCKDETCWAHPCPPHTIDSGVSCQKIDDIHRGVGKAIHSCQTGYTKHGLLCYQDCGVQYGEEFERHGALCIRKKTTVEEQLAKATELREQILAAIDRNPNEARLKEELQKLDAQIDSINKNK